MTANIYGIKSAAIELPVGCGHCIHFKHIASYAKVCSQLGFLPESPPCGRFNVDIHQLDAYGSDTIRTLLNVIGRMDTKDLPLVAALCQQESQTRVDGPFRLGQEVVIKLFSGEYVNNYAKGIILGLTRVSAGTSKEVSLDEATGNYVVKQNKLTRDYALVQGKQGFRATVYQTAILSLEDWTVVREALIRDNRINDPNNENSAKLSAEDDYELVA